MLQGRDGSGDVIHRGGSIVINGLLGSGIDGLHGGLGQQQRKAVTGVVHSFGLVEVLLGDERPAAGAVVIVGGDVPVESVGRAGIVTIM